MSDAALPIRTGRLARVLSIGLGTLIGAAVITVVSLQMRQARGVLPGWMLAGLMALNATAYILVGSVIGALAGLLLGSWLSRRYLWLFCATIGFFGPPLAVIAANLIWIDLPFRSELLIGLFAATGAGGLVLGVVLSRSRAGMARRSRRFAVLGAGLASLPAAILFFLLTRIHDDPLRTDAGTIASIVAATLLSTFLAALAGAVVGAERMPVIGFPVEPVVSIEPVMPAEPLPTAAGRD